MRLQRLLTPLILLLSASAHAQSVAAPSTHRGFTRENLVAEYRFDDGAGTTLTDYSGNGFGGTISGATWTVGGLAFDRANSARVALPSSLYSGGIGSMMWCYDTTANLTDPNWGLDPIFGSDDPNGLYLSGSYNVGRNTRIQVGWRGVADTTADETWGLHCVTWVGGGSTNQLDKIYVDGAPTTKYLNGSQVPMLSPNAESAGNMILNPPLTQFGTPYIGYTNQGQWAPQFPSPAFMTGYVYYGMIWSAPMSQQQVLQNAQAALDVLKRRGIDFPSSNTDTTSRVECFGDSRTQGIPDQRMGGPTPWCDGLTGPTSSGTSWQLINSGISGGFAQDFVVGATAKVAQFSPNAPWNIGTFLGVTNDLNGLGSTPQQAFNTLEQWTSLMHRHGVKTVCLTEPYRAGNTPSGMSSDAARLQYNQLVYAHPQDCDALVDLGRDSFFGNADGMSPSAVSCTVTGGATAFSSDGLHFTACGNQYIQTEVQQAINNLASQTETSVGNIPQFLYDPETASFNAAGQTPQVIGGWDLPMIRINNCALKITGGAGMELAYCGGQGSIMVYDRSSTPVMLPLNVESSNFTVNHAPVAQVISLTSSPIGGVSIGAGGCSYTSVTAPAGIVLTNSMGYEVSPQIYPGDAFTWQAYAVNSTTASVSVCNRSNALASFPWQDFIVKVMLAP